MIHVFHGDHIETSRKELTKLKTKFSTKEVVVLDGKTLTPTQFIQATEATSLFGGERLVIIENLLSKQLGRKTKDLEPWASLIKKIPEESDVVFWEEKELGKTLLNLFPKKSDIAIFKLDASMFQFVESIRPKNQVTMLSLFEKVVREESAEFGFAMLTRQLRLLIMVKDLGTQIGLSPWQASKLAKQAEYFTLPQLLALYEKLYTIDTQIKSGTSAFSMKEALELWLVEV